MKKFSVDRIGSMYSVVNKLYDSTHCIPYYNDYIANMCLAHLVTVLNELLALDECGVITKDIDKNTLQALQSICSKVLGNVDTAVSPTYNLLSKLDIDKVVGLFFQVNVAFEIESICNYKCIVTIYNIYRFNAHIHDDKLVGFVDLLKALRLQLLDEGYTEYDM